MRQDVVAHTTHIAYEKPAWLEDRLAWFRSLKFGIIIHWAPYSQWDCCESWPLVPEDDWARNPEMRCWNKRNYDLDRFQRDYWDLAKTFNPTEFDPDEWAETFAASGAKYVCFTTKHHDGFCMWDTQTTDYKITGEISPFRTNPNADVVRSLFDACRKAGLAISAYFSKADWHCPYYWDMPRKPQTRGGNTVDDPETWSKFVIYTHEQIRELMTDYGPIDLLWLDAGWVQGKEDLRMAEMVTMARELQPGLIVVNRAVGDEFEDILTPERHLPSGEMPSTWEACIPLASNWKYIEGEEPRSVDEVRAEIRHANVHGGNLLLGVAPMPSGRLPERQVAVLRQLGRLAS